ncbi:hypothetical protein NEOLEDRAFT_1246369 [Neolentinus lepideus HHB14362 ss-1]|uniref:Uncharacterized protein n=1 Tax=Neolentinus lepideus HHB14362 ss-1 TaxID=1314782 RepID=A0A165MNU8_9AGAM|nr:hypothetical protein NEOLEDRAFT_1246369 [Neolentinus lepideus HHB14362 ss-1]
MDVHDADSGRPVKRFKHQSYNASLKDVHLPSALALSNFDHEIPAGSSHFREAIDNWRQLNLSPAFLAFANRVDGLSASMPLLLHHWREIVDLWTIALDESDDEGVVALADLLQKLVHDLRTTISPAYQEILARLLDYLPRKIPAPTLTAVLSALSALFKYLLIPSTEGDLLNETWDALRDVLVKCNGEVQRAVAEVWGAVLRRFKSAVRERAVELIAGSVEGIEDACAWMVVFACKSVSQTLHTATTSILTPLLQYHLACEESGATYTLLRRPLTAFIHHCKGPEQFTAVADLLVDQFTTMVQTKDKDSETLRRMLEIMAVVCSVRQGSRLTQKHISTVLSHISSIPVTESLEESLLKLTISTLISGDLSLSLGPGRKVVEQSLQYASFALQLYGSLAEMEWGGWKLIGLPNLLKAVPELLRKEPGKTIELVAVLQRKGMITDVEKVLGEWVRERLAGWEKSEEKVLELASILPLSTAITNIAEPIIRIIEAVLDIEDPKADYENSYANCAWVLGSCMEALSTRNPAEWTVRVDLTLWAEKVVNRWTWSEKVLEGIVALVEARPSPTRKIAFEDMYPKLQDAVFSHIRGLRLSSLRLLTSPLVQASESIIDALKRCLQAEEVSLDVRGVRERSVKITRLPLSIKDDASAEAATRWLIAQFKVNLRPNWAPTSAAVVALSQRFGDLVWDLVFSQLQKVSQGEVDVRLPSWAQEEIEDGSRDDIWEDEKSWRDPSAHKVRITVKRWRQDNIAGNEIKQAQKSGDRLDTVSYESQLLSTLGECVSLAEKHNRDLVSFFLSLTAPKSPAMLPRPKLSAWLTLFSKFTNPKALHSTETLHSLYISLLSHPDRALQRLAFSCLLTYRSPSLLPHEDSLRALLDDTKWRDELTMLRISEIEEKDRPELVSVLLRMLFGIMLEKRGRSRGADRRASVLTTLGGCTDQELEILVDLMLDPLQSARAEEDTSIMPASLQVSVKQQLGFLTLLGDVLRTLGSRLVGRWPDLLRTAVSLISHAHQSLDATKQEVEQAEEASQASEPEPNLPMKSLRTIRQLGLKRLADFAKVPVEFDFSPYMTEVFLAFISPRMDRFETENTQAPSALLELFHVWACRKEYVTYLTAFDGRVVPKIYDCLVAPNVKPAVIARIFDIIEHLFSFSESDQALHSVLVPDIPLLLTNLTLLVEQSKDVVAVTSPLGQRQISILCQIVDYVNDDAQAAKLLKLFLPILRKPSKVVGDKVKVDILKIIEHILPLAAGKADIGSSIYLQSYDVLSTLFQTLRFRSSRIALLATFRKATVVDSTLEPLVDLLDSLNAYSDKRLDEPDFDRRLSAFTTLNEQFYSSLTSRQWIPVLYNMLYFIQDPEELAVRHSASLGIKRFIDAVTTSKDKEFELIFVRNLYPALRNGLRTKYEMVRAEVLGVISYAATRCDFVESLRDLRVLCTEGDEEANFFNNVLHVQIHRRTRALRRLADVCDQGLLKSSTLNEVLIPLVGHFVTSPASLDHHLVNEAVLTTGHMAKCLAWSAYYTLVQQYIRLCQKKGDAERVYVRTLVAILDSFHFQMDDSVAEEEKEDHDDEGDHIVISSKVEARNLCRIEELVTTRLLPSLLSHLEKRDETEDSLRIPIAVGVVQVAKHLPAKARELQVSRLLTIVSQALRSRSQETRDLVRETLCRIIIILGPEYLPLIMRELRAALQRGPHLHVLAFVTHALLVHVITGEHASRFETLDGCVEDVGHVSAEVIFGQSGRDVQAEEFRTKMREVRSSASKGLDSFAIMAKFITPSKISRLLSPIKAVMQETETLKVMQQVDDLLRRVTSGLNANKHLVPTELLVLCHTLISQNARFLQASPAHTKGKGKGKEGVIGQLKRPAPAASDHYAHNSYKFVAFGLDLFNTAFKRSRFDFQDKSVIARLEPMVSVIGNAIYSSNTQVTSLALKASSAIVKCPLRSIEKTLPVFIRRSIDIIKETGSAASELVQTALKSLAAILRDSPKAEVKEKDLTFLLELLSPDLEEPSRQPSVFAMLRAIVARKFVVPEIYDVMDKVSEIMVTSQSSQVQELCRGVLLQFLLDYPQGKGRLRNSMTFFARNLSYVHESGRKSVMELLNAIITKFDVTLIREHADLLFVALVMVIANDDAARCREMAAELVKSLLVRVDEERRRLLVAHLHSWAAQAGRPALARVSSQVYGLLLDALHQDASLFLPTILEDLGAALRRSAGSDVIDEDEDEDAQIEWQAPYQALIVSGKVLREFPDLTRQADKIQWPTVVSHLLYSHSWVRLASCRLLGTLFSAIPVAAAPDSELSADDPLSRIGMEEVARKLCTQLKSQYLAEALSLQIVKNLFYIGKCFASIPLPAPSEDAEQSAGEEDDGEQKGKATHPLPWLFSRLSYQARSAHIARRNTSRASDNWSYEPSAVLKWFAAMASFLPPAALARFLVHILTPVYRIVEDDTVRDAHMDELKTLATELQDLVREKVGTTAFAGTYTQIRQGALEVRRHRKTARAVLVTTNPEAAAKRKQGRNVSKKEGRKRKSVGFQAEGKGRIFKKRREY